MTNYAGASMEEQLKKLMQENVEYSKEIYRLSLQVKRYIFWGRIMSAIQLLFILVPIILGLVFLPPLIGDFFAGITGTGLPVTEGTGESLPGMLEQYKQILDIYN